MPESTLTLCQSRLYPPVRDLEFGLSELDHVHVRNMKIFYSCRNFLSLYVLRPRANEIKLQYVLSSTLTSIFLKVLNNKGLVACCHSFCLFYLFLHYMAANGYIWWCWWVITCTWVDLRGTGGFFWLCNGDFCLDPVVLRSKSVIELTHSYHGTRTCDLPIRGSTGPVSAW